ncbi:transcriptional repressor [Bacteriovoracales bacterium]|nr:transcriptional repressor [Bacteriovoracales bacterium]
MNQLEQVRNILQSHALRITQSRLAVATVLIKNNTLLTTEEIYKQIQRSKKLSCDQASVYRTLATFEELGLVKKSIFQGEPSRYMLDIIKRKNVHHHEHFFKCNGCNIIKPLKGCLISKQEKKLEENGYRNLNHHLEIKGLCPSCAQTYSAN